MRNVSCRLLLVLLAGAVAGCHSGKTDESKAAPPQTQLASVSAIPVATPPTHPKRPRPQPPAATTLQIQPVVPQPQIDEVIGWNESEIRTVFGAPASQEDQAPTKRFVYRSRECTLDVTLYPEVETRQFHALNYEVNADDGSAKRQQACVAEFSSRLPASSLAK